MNGAVCGTCEAPYYNKPVTKMTRECYGWSTLDEIVTGCWTPGPDAKAKRLYVVQNYGEDAVFCWKCLLWRRGSELKGFAGRGPIICQHCDSSYRKAERKLVRVDGQGCNRCWTRDEVLLL